MDKQEELELMQNIRINKLEKKTEILECQINKEKGHTRIMFIVVIIGMILLTI